MVGSSQTKANDQMGSRFTVTSELLDTIYRRNPNTEVGLVFFRGKLYMDPFDEPDLMQQIDPINPYSIINASNIEDGDSINISFKVFDTLNNEQTNDNNLKSEIEIRTYINETWLPEEVEFELKATLLDYDKSLEINKVYN